MRKLVLIAVLTALTASVFAAGRRDDRDRRSRGNSNRNSTQYDNSRSRGNYNSDRSRSRNRRDDRRYDDSRSRRTTDTRYDDSRSRRTTDTRYDDSRSRRTTTDTRYDDRRSTRTYRTYRHTPYRDHVRHDRRWRTASDYHRTVRPIYVYNNRWLRISVSYANGYYWDYDYPYFIYNGYRHRYSTYDTCNYELVDSYTDTVERTFYSYSCSTGYDLCADLRDDFNYYENNYRYFCAERFNW